ncbi:MAG: sigma-70 family RNA polymerase sigma factor [Acidobacteriota bacterium]|nr:sigma-70 family RNA polymerase sigma factor [Acidobacteriota bacterium]
MSVPGEPVSGAAESLVLGGPLSRARVRRPRSDRSLIAGAAAGVESDLEQLFRRHWPRAYRAAFLIVQDHAAAEDVTQEAFVAAVRTLDRFDRRRPFAPWLGAIVSNRAIDCARARRSRREVADPPEREHVSASSPRIGRCSEELLVALAELSPEQRTVVVMRYLLEFTPGEIARALELPRGTVNSRLRRGLDTLESRLRETGLR